MDNFGESEQSTSDQDSAIEHAVLNHDRLVEENTELREALRLLVSNGIEINNIDEIEDEEDAFTVQSNFNDALIKANQLLNK